MRLHAARWRLRGEPGLLGDPAIQEFHRRVVARCVADGTLRLYVLWRAGEPCSVIYAFAGPDTTYCYLSGFSPAVASHSLSHSAPGAAGSRTARSSA